MTLLDKIKEVDPDAKIVEIMDSVTVECTPGKEAQILDVIKRDLYERWVAQYPELSHYKSLERYRF